MPLSKSTIIHACETLLLSRIAAAEAAMQAAQEAANGEEKSSMGDKYETSRAMGQLDRDMNARQLAAARAELGSLRRIDPAKTYTHMLPGAACDCGDKIFFIAVGLGVINVEEKAVTVLSAQAPLAKQLSGKKAGDTFTAGNQTLRIVSVY